MQHPDEGTMHAWVDDALPANEAALVASHIASCAACAAAIAEARGLAAASSRIISALDVTPVGVIPAFAAPRTPRRWSISAVSTAIAATLVVAAGTMVTMRGRVADPIRANDTSANRPIDQLPPKPTAPTQPQTPPARTQQDIAATSGNAAQKPVSVARSEDRVAEQTKAARVPLAPAPAPSVATAPVEAHQSLGSMMARPMAQGALAMSASDSSVKVVAAAQTDSVMAARRAADPLKVVADASSGSGMASGRAVARSSAARVSAAQPPPRMVAEPATEASVFAGCYELNASVDVIPKRFALRVERVGVAGAREVRYVDSTGVVGSLIPDATWVEAKGGAAIHTNGRGEVLVILRAGDAVAAQSAIGPRTIVVTACR